MTDELINTKFNIKRKLLWHSTQIYCLAFDRNGEFVFTGGDDGVLRVYSISKDTLIKSLTDQNSDEFTQEVEEVCRKIDFNIDLFPNIESQLEKFAICDVAVNHENTLVSAAKHNGSVLIWNLQTFELIIKFDESMFPIRSVVFSAALFPNDRKYLISTSEDGFIFFYVYNYKTLNFEKKALHRRSKYDSERAINICMDITSGGLLMGLMHTFGIKQELSKPKSKKESPISSSQSEVQSAIRILSLNDETGVREEWKTTYHKSHTDCVYSLRFAHNTFRFASACDKDSNAFIWTFDKSNKKWDSIIIGINTKDDNKKLLRGKSKKSESVFVEEIVFSCGDKYMITILTDISIKVWNSDSGELVQHFDKYHSIKISVVECHPKSDNIFMSAGYDSNIYIYDILRATILYHFNCNINSNQIEGNSINETSDVLKPLLLQCSFSPNGQTIAATDNIGNLTIFCIESLPKESNSLDQLEEFLSKVYSESDEETPLTEVGVKPSLKESQYFKDMFDYETELLRGIQTPTPSKSTQNTEEKKNVSKVVKKLDLEFESTDKETDKLKPKTVAIIKPKYSNKKFIPPYKKSSQSQKDDVSNESVKERTEEKTETKKPETPKTAQITKPLKTPESANNRKSIKPKMSGSKQMFTKNMFISILDEIFENPSSRPFQLNDEIQYPTFRKMISDANLSLTSIREEMSSTRYSFTRFNKEMNKVIENAKKFYKHIDEEVYDMALTLEKFYCNKMKTQFGDSFKPPLNVDTSDDESEENTNKDKQLGTETVSKIIVEENVSKDNNKVEDSETPNTSVLRPKTIRKKTPKVNGTPKQISKRVKSIDNSSDSNQIESNRKRTTNLMRNNLELEPTPEKRLKCDEKIEDSVEDNNQNLLESLEVQNNNINDQKSDSQNEELIDFGVRAEEEVDIDVNKNVTKSDSLTNGNTTENSLCDNSVQCSTQLKNSLFCIFCDKIFWSISEAKSHYIFHLCPLKCSKCVKSFITYDEYLSHSCEYPKTPNNIEWCRQYSDTINWIEKFLEYQQTEDIETFDPITKSIKNCIVCEKVEQFRPDSNHKTKEIKPIEHNLHLEKHLKYVPQFQCLICLLNHDNYFYCKNSAEAEQHMTKDHSTYQIHDSNVLNFFDGSVPKLDEIILQFYS